MPYPRHTFERVERVAPVEEPDVRDLGHSIGILELFRRERMVQLPGELELEESLARLDSYLLSLQESGSIWGRHTSKVAGAIGLC